MNVADRARVIEFIEMFAFEIAGNPNRGSLRQVAWAAVTREMRRMAQNYQQLQCIDRTRSRTRAQHVIISDWGTYVLSQRPIGQIFSDFPQYRVRNGAQLNVTNETYYRIDKAIYEDAERQPNQPFVAAIITPCGSIEGNPIQQIKFLDAGGVETSTGFHAIDFAWPLDP